MHRFADVGEPIILTAFIEPALVEPIAVLLGGGLAHIDRGMDGVGDALAPVHRRIPGSAAPARGSTAAGAA